MKLDADLLALKKDIARVSGIEITARDDIVREEDSLRMTSLNPFFEPGFRPIVMSGIKGVLRLTEWKAAYQPGPGDCQTRCFLADRDMDETQRQALMDIDRAAVARANGHRFEAAESEAAIVEKLIEAAELQALLLCVLPGSWDSPLKLQTNDNHQYKPRNKKLVRLKSRAAAKVTCQELLHACYQPEDRRWSEEPYNWGDLEALKKLRKQWSHGEPLWSVARTFQGGPFCMTGDQPFHKTKDPADLMRRLAVQVETRVQLLVENEWLGLVPTRRRSSKKFDVEIKEAY
jgi:hypothetical protein